MKYDFSRIFEENYTCIALKNQKEVLQDVLYELHAQEYISTYHYQNIMDHFSSIRSDVIGIHLTKFGLHVDTLHYFKFNNFIIKTKDDLVV